MGQLRQKQKEKVAEARRERLRRSSESSPSDNRKSQPAEDKPDFMVDRSYGELETHEIVNQYSNHLPLKVVVSKGVYGMEERYSLASSDMCIIHHIKRRELIQIQDPMRNKEFSVPLNTAIKFGVLYNPNNMDREAMKGFEFKYVSDILAETRMPKMGLAHLKDPDILGMKSAEVLVVKDVSVYGVTTWGIIGKLK